MSDYQAIYDAVRSRIANGDVGQAVEQVLRELNLSWHAERIEARIMDAVAEYDRPSTVYKPKLMVDGNQWMALFGDNIQEGVCGWGNSPAEAYVDFDREWNDALKGGS